MSRLLSVTVELENVAGVSTIRTVLHDAKGDGHAMATNSFDESDVQDMIVAEQLRAIAKYITRHGVPDNVPATETPDSSSQGN